MERLAPHSLRPQPRSSDSLSLPYKRDDHEQACSVCGLLKYFIFKPFLVSRWVETEMNQTTKVQSSSAEDIHTKASAARIHSSKSNSLDALPVLRTEHKEGHHRFKTRFPVAENMLSTWLKNKSSGGFNFQAPIRGEDTVLDRARIRSKANSHENNDYTKSSEYKCSSASSPVLDAPKELHSAIRVSSKCYLNLLPTIIEE